MDIRGITTVINQTKNEIKKLERKKKLNNHQKRRLMSLKELLNNTEKDYQGEHKEIDDALDIMPR